MSFLNDAAREDLAAIMKRDFSLQASKVVHVQKNILKALTHLSLFSTQFCSAHNISCVAPLTEKVDAGSAAHILYFVNPNVESLRELAAHITSSSQAFPSASLSVYFVPQKPLMVEHILKEEYRVTQLFPNTRFGEYDVDAMFFEGGAILMQQPRIFRHLYVDGNVTSLKWIARLLLKMQTAQFGAIRHIKGKGKNASMVVRMLSNMEREVGNDFLTDLSSEVDSLLILDRTVDPATPLLTQLTYEGLIDELYDLSSCEAVFPFPLSESDRGQDSSHMATLDNNDKIFTELRDKNFSMVGSSLYQKSLWVKQSYEKRKEVHELKELKEFMKGLPEMQEAHRQVSIHTSIATEIGKTIQASEFRKRVQMEQNIIQQLNEKDVLVFIEDLISRQEKLETVLRLICLFSFVNGGLRQKEYDVLKQMMMLAYGIPLIISAFHSLELCGLISRTSTRSSNYPAVRKCFRAWDSSLNERQPSDISYAYSGYASVLVRLIEMLVSSPQSWSEGGNFLDLLPGEKAELRHNVSILGSAKKTIVFVIGGITAAEMSSLRFVQSKLAKPGSPHDLIVMSTDITTGNRLINSVLSARDI